MVPGTGSSNRFNIVKIKPIKMKKYEQLENQIKELQAEVERLKKEEEKPKLPEDFSRQNSIAFLENPNSTLLSDAFSWITTSQGLQYWAEIRNCLKTFLPIRSPKKPS